MAEAGFRDVSIALQERTVSLPESEVADFVTMASKIGAMGEALREITDPSVTNAVLEGLRSAIEERIVEGVASLKAAAWLVSATR